MTMAKFPYLAKYNNTSQNDGVVLLMMEPKRGIILYIPTSLPADDPRLELSIMETMNPANSEIDSYDAAITFRNSTGPTLED